MRNPNINGLCFRENPRYFGQTMFDLRKIQTGREIPELDVLSIYYILKNRAKKYIASYELDRLYPEKHMPKTIWNKIGSKYFLFPDPRKVSFTSGIFTGNDDGPIWAQDEYGRLPDNKNPEIKRKRDKEWGTFNEFKKTWESIYGPLNQDELRKYF